MYIWNVWYDYRWVGLYIYLHSPITRWSSIALALDTCIFCLLLRMLYYFRKWWNFIIIRDHTKSPELLGREIHPKDTLVQLMEGSDLQAQIIDIRDPLVCPFAYWGLIQFLIRVEYKLDYMGNKPVELQNATNQLVYNMHVQLVESQNLPTTLADRTHVEHHQMRKLLQEKSAMEHQGRIGTMMGGCLWNNLMTQMVGYHPQNERAHGL